MYLKKPVLIFLTLALSACTSMESKEFLSEMSGNILFDKKFDLEYSDLACAKLQNSCSYQGEYTEWKQDNGTKACRCLKN